MFYYGGDAVALFVRLKEKIFIFYLLKGSIAGSLYIFKIFY